MSVIVCSRCCKYIDTDFDSERIMEIDGEYVCDSHDDFWHQQELDERRRQEEEIEKDWKAFRKVVDEGRPWWFCQDQETGKMIKVGVGMSISMNIHHVSRWDIKSKTLKSDNGDKWETRDFIIYGGNGEELFSITMFMDYIGAVPFEEV